MLTVGRQHPSIQGGSPTGAGASHGLARPHINKLVLPVLCVYFPLVFTFSQPGGLQGSELHGLCGDGTHLGVPGLHGHERMELRTLQMGLQDKNGHYSLIPTLPSNTSQGRFSQFTQGSCADHNNWEKRKKRERFGLH